MRTVPSNGRVLFPKGDDNLTAVREDGLLERGGAGGPGRRQVGRR